MEQAVQIVSETKCHGCCPCVVSVLFCRQLMLLSFSTKLNKAAYCIVLSLQEDFANPRPTFRTSVRLEVLVRVFRRSALDPRIEGHRHLISISRYSMFRYCPFSEAMGANKSQPVNRLQKASTIIRRAGL